MHGGQPLSILKNKNHLSHNRSSSSFMVQYKVFGKEKKKKQLKLQMLYVLAARKEA